MAEAMQQDQAAGLIVARWPDVRSPFFGDLLRGVKYSPVIGRFVTFREFFERTDTPMRHTRYEAGEYLAPFLTRSVAAREANPITRYCDHFERRHRFESALWLRSMAAILRGKRLHEVDASAVEELVEAAGPDVRQDANPPATQAENPPHDLAIVELARSGEKELAQTILHGTAGKTPGVLIVNPCSFTRRVPITWPPNLPLPAHGGAVKGVFENHSVREALVEAPACGFVWIPVAKASETKPSADEIKTPLVQDDVLRNEFFEVHVSSKTGGIQQLKEYGRKPNRLSQQLAFRFPRERSIKVSDDDTAFEEKTYYSATRCLGMEVVSRGPWLGEIRTHGEIIDQKTDAVLATFQQSFRLWRGRRLLDIDIELDAVKMPDGEPWTNYFGVRWAWMDTTAALTRSVLGAAQPLGQDRFESPYYLEIADDDTRTTIINHGLSYHRKTGGRMCDSLLIVEGETRRHFRFSIAYERPYPLQAAWDAMCPVAVIPTDIGPPRCGTTGWFLQVDTPSVQLSRLTDLMDEPRSDAPSWESAEPPPLPSGNGFAVRLQETEGRQQSVALKCFRTPLSVRQRDFIGRTSGQPRIEGDSVRLSLSPFEITDVELRFDPTPTTD